jgi:hypothetical protein
MAALAIVLGACSSGGGGSGTGGASTTASGTTGAGGTGTTATTTTGTTTTTTTMPGDGGGDTWANYAQGFFAMYCVECHNAADPTQRDYDKLADVMKDSATIRCGVAAVAQPGCGSSPPPKQFPISDANGTNPKPSDAERARIVAWIDAGLPP